MRVQKGKAGEEGMVGPSLLCTVSFSHSISSFVFQIVRGQNLLNTAEKKRERVGDTLAAQPKSRPQQKLANLQSFRCT